MAQQPARETLEREFLPLRGKLLELAAALDRIERSGDGPVEDARLEQIDRALTALRQPGTDRAERLQMIFSLPYEPNWNS